MVEIGDMSQDRLESDAQRPAITSGTPCCRACCWASHRETDGKREGDRAWQWGWAKYRTSSGWAWHTSSGDPGLTLFLTVPLLSRVLFSVTPRTAEWQASLSFTISRGLCKLMCIKSVMLPNHLMPFVDPYSSYTTTFYGAFVVCSHCLDPHFLFCLCNFIEEK